MRKNVPKPERIVRIVLGIVFVVMALLSTGWPGWARWGSTLTGVAFLATAFVGY
jgi:hypothetical protein